MRKAIIVNLLSKRTRYIAVVTALLVLMVSSVTGAAAAPSAPSFVMYWKFDEGNGFSVSDASDNYRSGGLFTSSATPPQFTSSVAPKINFANPYALNLIGTSRQYVNAGTGINLANTSFTVMAWAKRSTTAGKQWVIGYGTNSVGKALVLGFRDNDHVTCAFFGNDLDTAAGVDPDGTSFSGKFADTNWHHLACTYDAATRTRIVYVDGKGWKMDGSTAIQTNGVFNVGRVPWGEGYFSGTIDDVRVYNRALSQASIEWLAKGNLDTTLLTQ
jgi:hypothetical protein